MAASTSPSAPVFPANVFREYDVRGVAERDLTDAFAHALGHAFASLLADELGRAPEIALGRDGRLSSPRLFAAMCDGLVQAGARVHDVGIGPSPLLYFAAHHLATDGALQITGSHNPGEDNGFKMMRGKGPFFGADIQALRRRMAAPAVAAATPGSVREIDVSDAYIAALVGATRMPGAKRPRVVIDAGNGAAGPLALRVFEALGFEVDALHCTIDGRFPNHHPDPTVLDNLKDLIARVRETGAPLGIAFDGDGDRIGAVDEHGQVIWGDKLMILFSRALLREHAGATILGEVKCSETLFADVGARGGKALYCRTGHSLIKTMMKQEGALLAGEMSGHMFFADRYFGFDDATYAAVRLLEIVVAEGKTLGGLLSDVPVTYATPELRVPCADDRKVDVVGRVLEHYRPRRRVLDIDGARIDFGEGAWGLCRASNTQPILVLRFEARSEARLAEIRAEVEAVVAQASL